MHMASAVTVGPARPRELSEAFQLLFRPYGEEESARRTANALRLVRQGELDPAGVMVARTALGLIGAMVSMKVAGAGGLVWPPQAVGEDPKTVEDLLVRQTIAWLRQTGARLAQSLLPTEEAGWAQPLGRNGFKHVTRLWYMRHQLGSSMRSESSDQGLVYVPFSRCDRSLFEATLLRTYEQTLDCPEVSGVRTIDEIIAGHQAQGKHDPDRWWLALEEGRPVAVLLLTEAGDWPGWDLSYVGVVPEARGRGIGRALTRKAIVATAGAGENQLTLSVDVRNEPAGQLYRSLGFEVYDQREVYLCILDRSHSPSDRFSTPGSDARARVEKKLPR
jgi:ribosomal protein S18 acetylase RimI-like enzyme